MISTNTQVQVESASGIREISLETKLMEDRKIFLSGEINMDMANDFMRQMMYLDDESGRDINIYINSVGGEIMAGMLIYDVIQAANCPLNVYCTGYAYSMAAVLLASGPEGRRYILPHSEVMIHEPLITDGVGGSATNIERLSNSLLEKKSFIIDLLEKHSKKTKEELEEAIRYDKYLKPDEAIEFGLCDEVVTRLY